MSIYVDLFTTFAKIGGVTFGGGYAMFPILERELVQKHGWVENDEIVDYYAIGQCTPGIIAVNIATFVGHKKAGVLGAICGTLGMVFPSIIIIGVIALFLANFADIPMVINAFAGIRVGTTVLILYTILKLWKKSVEGKMAVGIFLIALCLSLFTPISPPIIVGVTAIVFWLGSFRKVVKK